MKLSASKLSRILASSLIAAAACAGALHLPRQESIALAASRNEAPTREPVLVELFTSEGCSSCPPADALLARLDATQFVPGADAIVLSEHVTYWNQLGWRDPFSSDAMTDRQNHYAQQFGLGSVYTPQAVVDGSLEVVGSDSAALSHAITRASKKTKVQLQIEGAQREGDAIHFTVHASPATQGNLMAALAEDATQSSVARGENAGRTLHHVAVVRVIKDMGRDAVKGSPLTLALTAEQEKPAQKLRLVVFVVNPQTGQVDGVTEQPLPK